VLRESHAASVSGTTQHNAARDPNFELVGDGYYSRTVDPGMYALGEDGSLTRRRAHIAPSALAHSGPWHSTREFAPLFLPGRVVRCLHVSVPSFFQNFSTQADAAGNAVLVEADVLPEQRQLLVHNHVLTWLADNVATTAEWRAAPYEKRVFELKGEKPWGWYHFVWSLGVVFAVACGCTFGAPKQSSIVVYLDRETYGLTRKQMELLIHAVFHERMQHPLHRRLGHGGVPYAAGTAQDSKLTYQLGWEADTVDQAPKRMDAWPAEAVAAAAAADDNPAFAPSHAAAAAFGKTVGKTELVASFGKLFALDVGAAYEAVQGRTTLFDEDFRKDVTKAESSRSYLALHVLFKDMFTDESSGPSLNTEGDDLGVFGGLCAVGVPRGMSAQRMAQLLDRINRVDTSITSKTRRNKFVVLITRPDSLYDAQAPLQRMGTNDRDRAVDTLNEELVRNAYDCEQRDATERSAFACG
jgi:hypothetical protein